jgi:hypothetical protein
VQDERRETPTKGIIAINKRSFQESMAGNLPTHPFFLGHGLNVFMQLPAMTPLGEKPSNHGRHTA